MGMDRFAGGGRATRLAPKPLIEATQSTGSLVVLWIFLLVPFAALIAAVPLAWGWGLSALDATMAVIGYAIAMAGATVGFHRHLTHGSFKARRGLHIALAVAGSLAVEGTPTEWVADHRRHHAFTDREGDPHSPWRYGTGVAALAKGGRAGPHASSVSGRSPARTRPPTSGRWRSCRSGRVGTVQLGRRWRRPTEYLHPATGSGPAGLPVAVMSIAAA